MAVLLLTFLWLICFSCRSRSSSLPDLLEKHQQTAARFTMGILHFVWYFAAISVKCVNLCITRGKIYNFFLLLKSLQCSTAMPHYTISTVQIASHQCCEAIMHLAPCKLIVTSSVLQLCIIYLHWKLQITSSVLQYPEMQHSQWNCKSSVLQCTSA
jgi:hypothetical protein